MITDARELQRITGQHQLFLGIGTHAWSLDQFRQCARFAKAHGVDSLLIKTHEGALPAWYGSIGGWNAVKRVVQSEGVGAIPYTFSYGGKFNALDAEIDILLQHMRDDGIVCLNAEEAWNSQVGWAQHLCSRMQGQAGIFMVSTWSDPSLQNWLGVIRALAPCVDVWCPQQYNNFLAKFWVEFGAINGVDWLQPTINLTQDFGANDPVQIVRAAAGQKHTAISVWHYDTAIANPGLLDAVYAAFPKGEPVNNTTYEPGKGDFDAYFVVEGNDWVCKKFNTRLFGGNKALFSQLSLDGNSLPIIGLPRTNELYQHDSDGYAWSVLFYERGLIVYDPKKRWDSQPGMGDCYLGKYEQFKQYDPAYQLGSTIEKIPAALKADIEALPSLIQSSHAAWQTVTEKLMQDAGISN